MTLKEKGGQEIATKFKALPLLQAAIRQVDNCKSVQTNNISSIDASTSCDHNQYNLMMPLLIPVSFEV